MSLDDIIPDDAGESKGGRPKEVSKGPPETRGNPFTRGDDNEEYWQEVWDNNVGGDEPSMEEIASMSDYSAVMPWVVMSKLTEHGIYEFDQGYVREDYPSYMKAGAWPGGINNIDEEAFLGKEEKDDTDKNSGLLGLVEDAKD